MFKVRFQISRGRSESVCPVEGGIKTQFSDFKFELARVKEEVVTKVVFESFEARVVILEQVGV